MSDYAYKINAFLMIPFGVRVRLGCPRGALEAPVLGGLFEALGALAGSILRPRGPLGLPW